MTTIDTSKLRITFDDEFNTFSSSADGSTGWKTQLGFYGRSARNLYYNGEAQYYSDSSVGTNPFSVSNGVLSITASVAASGSNPYSLPYTSGVITTQTSFAQEYGYFEARVKMPAGKGFWSAFWMLPTSDTSTTTAELDIFEVLGIDPTALYETTHSTATGTNVANLHKLLVGDTSSAFHTYGVDWEPSTITFYIDGESVLTIATPSNMNRAMYMILSEAVGGSTSWAGAPSSSSEFPASMQIDYVRAYATANTINVSGTAAISTATTTLAMSGTKATLTKGNGNYIVTGTGGGYTLTLGAGSQTVTLGGWSNTITVGNGNSTIVAGLGYETIHTGSGTVSITAHGNGNLFDAQAGTNTYVSDIGSVHNTYMLNASGVTTITGFGVSGYDTLNLTRTLGGISIKSDLSNLSSYVTAVTSGGNTTLYLDTTGKGLATTAFAVLKGVSTTVAQLVAKSDIAVS